jgi:hypothetical protein
MIGLNIQIAIIIGDLLSCLNQLLGFNGIIIWIHIFMVVFIFCFVSALKDLATAYQS